MRMLLPAMIMMLLSGVSSIGIVSADVQTFISESRTIEIDLPQIFEAGPGSGDNIILLVEPGTRKPLFLINIRDFAFFEYQFKNLDDLAEYLIGSGKTFKSMATNDGNLMRLYAIPSANEDRNGNPVVNYYGFIDDTKEHGKWIVINGYNEFGYGSRRITYTMDQFAAICKSITIKNASETWAQPAQ